MALVVVETGPVAFYAYTVVALEWVSADASVSIVTAVTNRVNVRVHCAWADGLHSLHHYDLWLHSISHLRSNNCHTNWLLHVLLLLWVRLCHSVDLLLLGIGLRVLRLHWLLLVSHLLLRISHRLLGICHGLLWVVNRLLLVSHLLLRVPHWLLHLNLNLRLLHHLNSKYDESLTGAPPIY